MPRSATFIARSYADASEQEGALVGWEQRYIQVGRGRFEGATAFLDFGGISVGEERLNVDVAESTSPPPGKVAIIVHNEMVHGRINGQQSSAQLFLHRGGHQIDLSTGTAQGCSFYLVADETAFADINFRKLPTIGPITGYSEADELARWISSVISSAPETLRRSPGALERVLPAMLSERMSEICEHASHGTVVHLRESYAHSLFSRARKRVDDMPDDGLTVAALADELRVQQHVLRQAFIESTGVSPRVWLRQHRLGRARRAMLRPDGQPRTVAQIATEAGFFHLGRFAAYYAETFHESPIETLRAAAGL